MKRFWDKVDKTGDCWVWKAGKDGWGYGQFRYEGKNTKAHRVAYFLTHGSWPHHTRHACDNPSCVNPEHLLSESPQDNLNDMTTRDRHSWTLRNEQVREIRSLEYDETVVQRVCDQYNIPTETARNILSGKTYKHIEGGRPVPRQASKARILTPELIEEIEQELQNKYWGQQLDLAEKYNVSRFVIQQVQYGTYGKSRTGQAVSNAN